jgi:hypothetical protein
MQSSPQSSRRQASRTSRSPGARRCSTGRHKAPRRPPSAPRGSTSGRTSRSRRESLPGEVRSSHLFAGCCSPREGHCRLRPGCPALSRLGQEGPRRQGPLLRSPRYRCDRPIASLRKKRLRLRSANGRPDLWVFEATVALTAVISRALAVFGRGGSRQAPLNISCRTQRSGAPPSAGPCHRSESSPHGPSPPETPQRPWLTMA